MSIEKPLLLPHHPHLLLNHHAQIHPSITNKTLRLAVWTVSGKGCLQQEFQRGLPSFFQIQGSLSNYNLSWSKSVSWCGERKIDPYWFAIGKVLDYLSYLFDSGFEYRIIGCHRSTIFPYHEYTDSKTIRQHPNICALLKGVLNQRPPQPRYVFIWDI